MRLRRLSEVGTDLEFEFPAGGESGRFPVFGGPGLVFASGRSKSGGKGKSGGGGLTTRGGGTTSSADPGSALRRSPTSKAGQRPMGRKGEKRK